MFVSTPSSPRQKCPSPPLSPVHLPSACHPPSCLPPSPSAPTPTPSPSPDCSCLSRSLLSFFLLFLLTAALSVILHPFSLWQLTVNQNDPESTAFFVSKTVRNGCLQCSLLFLEIMSVTFKSISMEFVRCEATLGTEGMKVNNTHHLC